MPCQIEFIPDSVLPMASPPNATRFIQLDLADCRCKALSGQGLESFMRRLHTISNVTARGHRRQWFSVFAIQHDDFFNNQAKLLKNLLLNPGRSNRQESAQAHSRYNNDLLQTTRQFFAYFALLFIAMGAISCGMCAFGCRVATALVNATMPACLFCGSGRRVTAYPYIYNARLGESGGPSRVLPTSPVSQQHEK